MSETKECFVICPIGSEGSETRIRSNKLFNHIIEPAVSEYGYTPIRADRLSEPGSITAQVIEKTVESDLVIADLTNHNPNVFYELAIRHATAKPFIQLIDASQDIPFDISDLRTIEYDFDVKEAKEAVSEIQEQLQKFEQDNPEFDNPISKSASMRSWRESDDPEEQNLAEIYNTLNTLATKIDKVEHRIRRHPESQGGLTSSSLKEHNKEVEEKAVMMDDFEDRNIQSVEFTSENEERD